MRSISIILFLVFSLVLPVSAQQKTILGNGSESGIFVRPSTKFTLVKGEIGLIIGCRVAVIANKTFSFGLSSYALVNETCAPYKYPYNKSWTGRMYYGGFELGYITKANEAIHLNYYLLIGGGVESIKKDNFFIIEPLACFETNITEFFRIEIGAGFNLISSLEHSKYTENDYFSGPTVSISFKFGSFKKA